MDGARKEELLNCLPLHMFQDKRTVVLAPNLTLIISLIFMAWFCKHIITVLGLTNGWFNFALHSSCHTAKCCYSKREESGFTWCLDNDTTQYTWQLLYVRWWRKFEETKQTNIDARTVEQWIFSSALTVVVPGTSVTFLPSLRKRCTENCTHKKKYFSFFSVKCSNALNRYRNKYITWSDPLCVLLVKGNGGVDSTMLNKVHYLFLIIFFFSKEKGIKSQEEERAQH